MGEGGEILWCEGRVIGRLRHSIISSRNRPRELGLTPSLVSTERLRCKIAVLLMSQLGHSRSIDTLAPRALADGRDAPGHRALPVHGDQRSERPRRCPLAALPRRHWARSAAAKRGGLPHHLTVEPGVPV